MEKPLISIFLPTLLIGGAEKALVALANQLSAEGWRIELVLMTNKGPLAKTLGPAVALFDLRCASFRAATWALARYYVSREPSVILTSLYATGLAALAARLISRHRPKILIGAHNSLEAKVAHPDNAKDKWLLMPMCRLLFPLADGFVAVSKGVAHELETQLRLPREKIRAIYNPVITDELMRQSAEPLSHPWLKDPPSRRFKTLVSVGRLVEQKGYDILLHAFALARRELDCRLIIVGGGPLQGELENTAQGLGIRDEVDFAGWQTNPFKFVSSADLFVLSSRWEGLANVLIEALACGPPVVSTNCRYGPEEILEAGRYGALAAVDDPSDLAAKIVSSLRQSPNKTTERAARLSRALDFTATASARQYAAVFSEILDGSPKPQARGR